MAPAVIAALAVRIKRDRRYLELRRMKFLSIFIWQPFPLCFAWFLGENQMHFYAQFFFVRRQGEG
jgi:hypothetical protein